MGSETFVVEVVVVVAIPVLSRLTLCNKDIKVPDTLSHARHKPIHHQLHRNSTEVALTVMDVDTKLQTARRHVQVQTIRPD